MYYPVLSRIGKDSGKLAIGWLDHASPIPQGDIPDVFVERLWELCIHPIVQTRGFHECTFCPKEGKIRLCTRNQQSAYLGSGEICVRGKGKTYHAPNLIYHYITEHHYRPPEEFIGAVMRRRNWVKRQFERLIFNCQ